jgi:polyhydroxyalkanoate synthesis regulator phasin
MVVRREEIRAMQEAWRAYLDLALGLTETSRKRATKVAKKLVGKGNATAEQLQAMAEDLVSTSLANREALTRLVRYELERTLGRVGLATADEVTSLTSRVRELEQQLAEAKAGAAAPSPVRAAEVAELAEAATTGATATGAPARPVRRVAKKTAAPRKVAASASVPSGTIVPVEPPVVATVEGPLAEPAPPVEPPARAARRAAAKRTVAKRTAAPEPVAKKAVAKKAVATSAVPATGAGKKTTSVRKAAAKKAPAQEQP